MELIMIDDAGRLYLSPDIEDWKPLLAAGINVVIDLDGGIDEGVPTKGDEMLYIYFPFDDHGLPNLAKLHAVGSFGASMVRSGHTVLSHCAMGFNRSALMAGMILVYLGYDGPGAVAKLRERRPGALYNKEYAEYLTAEPARG